MITLNIENTKGETRAIEVEPEGTLMEAIRANGFDDLLARCGGFCSCATCHVVVDPACDQPLSTMSDDEDALLDSSDYREDTSRLSCQIPLSEDLDGLKVRIAKVD